MSGSHCSEVVFDGHTPAYRRALVAVIAINAVMFVVEFLGGAWAESQALQADSLDFLADAVTYSLSLAVIGSTLKLRARVAFFKGLSLLVMGAVVLMATAS